HVVCCVFGVSWSSFQTNLRPVEVTFTGHPAPLMPHSAMSISCTPWLPISPLPVSQNQCQLYLKRRRLNGRMGAGPRKRSQLTPGGVGSFSACPIDGRRLKQRPFVI